MKKIILFIILLFQLNLDAQEKRLITVAQDGSGDFLTITEAINSLPMFNYERTIIFIKNGIYEERFRIDQDYITLRGENRENTIIRYSILREDWNNNKDSHGPGVINVEGNDIIIENMTIENTQPLIGPHAFTIYGFGTRIIIQYCNVYSKGADTVSLWDYKTGMYYHANCSFTGSVDFVCPRGWCFIRDSQFYQHKQTAALWHAGGFNRNQKFVIVNSSFDGVKGFELGRHHYEAQFFLIDCSYSENMSSKPIYRVTYEDTTRNRPYNWGKRNYFFNSQKKGDQFEWLENNIESAGVSIDQIDAKWTFDNKWDPENIAPIYPARIEVYGKLLKLFFDEKITVIDKPILVSDSGNKLYYSSGGGTDTIIFESDSSITMRQIKNLSLINGKLTGTNATIKERVVLFTN